MSDAEKVFCILKRLQNDKQTVGLWIRLILNERLVKSGKINFPISKFKSE